MLTFTLHTHVQTKHAIVTFLRGIHAAIDQLKKGGQLSPPFLVYSVSVEACLQVRCKGQAPRLRVGEDYYEANGMLFVYDSSRG